MNCLVQILLHGRKQKRQLIYDAIDLTQLTVFFHCQKSAQTLHAINMRLHNQNILQTH